MGQQGRLHLTLPGPGLSPTRNLSRPHLPAHSRRMWGPPLHSMSTDHPKPQGWEQACHPKSLCPNLLAKPGISERQFPNPCA